MQVIEALNSTLTVKKSLETNIRKRNLFKNLDYLSGSGSNSDLSKNMEEIVVSQLQDLISNSESNITSQLINEYVYFLTNINLSVMRDLLIKTFIGLCESFRKEVEKSITTGNMNIKYMVNIWKRYISKTNRLHGILWYFNKRFVNNENKMSLLNTIRYFVFYKNVVNQQYKGRYLLDYVSESVGQVSPGKIINVIELFEMYRCFVNLKPVLKDDSFFNEHSDDIIIKKLNSSDNFCNSLARFIDGNIRHMKSETKDTVYKLILKALYVTKYIENKDVLQVFITKYLSFRLLSSDRTDIDFESNIISKMTELYGQEFTNSMVKILDDIKISRDLNSQYRSLNIKIKSDKYKGLEINQDFLSRFNTNILKMFYWNNINQDEVKYKIPVETDVFVEIFDKFYSGCFINRKLVWKFDMGDAVVAFNGLDKTYNLHMATLQMIVMMFMNDGKKTLEQIVDKSEMNQELVEFIIKGLVGSGVVVKKGDAFEHNDGFTYPQQNLSLLKFMKGAPKPGSSKKVEEENKKEEQKILNFTQKCDNISKEIVSFLTGKDNVKDSILFEHLKQTMPFEFSMNEVNSSLVQFLSKGLLTRTKEDTNVYYKLFTGDSPQKKKT